MAAPRPKSTEPALPETRVEMSENRYSYKSLATNSFRLLEIQPGELGDPIHVRLLDAALDDAPSYDALSYVWGDETDTLSIHCDETPFQITRNLHWALSRVRLTDSPRKVWADAISINQDDLGERSEQVCLMGQIYNGASQVVASFGDASAEQANDLMSIVHDLERTVSSGKVFALTDEDPLWDDARLESLAALTSRPWFTRSWVLQEVGLASNPYVLFGQAEVNYRLLIDIISAFPLPLTTKFNIQAWIVHVAWAEYWLEQSNQHQFTFLDLLGHASFLNCKDPRDRIYAFLGHPLATAYTGAPLITPNYEQSWEEVYLEVTTRLLEVEGLRVLTKVNNTEASTAEDLPSWVVRWDACRINNRIYHSLTSSFWASAGFRQDALKITQDNLLKLKGVKIDRILRSYQILPTLDGQIQCERYRDIDTGEETDIRGVIKFLGDDETPYAYKYSKADALCLTLSCCPSEDTSLSKDFHLEIPLYCPNRSFFITEKGFYGLGPDITRRGDFCCILFGAHVLFILRAQGGHFKLLGESYVRGLMGGQVEEILRRGEVSVTQFDIY